MGVTLLVALGARVVEASCLLNEVAVKSQPFIAPLVNAQIQAHPVCDHGVRHRRDSGVGVDGHGWTVLGVHRLLSSGVSLEGVESIIPAQSGQERISGLGATAHQGWRQPERHKQGGHDPAVRGGQGGSPEMARLLIEAGADLNTTNKDGTTPLYIAVFLEHEETAKALMDAGAKLAITDKDNVTPLHSAVAKEDLTIIMALINMGFDVNVKDQNNMTPLHAAVTKGDMEMTKALISAGADLNCKDKGGNTPLDLAATEGHGDIAKALIKAGAHVNPVDQGARRHCTRLSTKATRTLPKPSSRPARI